MGDARYSVEARPFVVSVLGFSLPERRPLRDHRADLVMVKSRPPGRSRQRGEPARRYLQCLRRDRHSAPGAPCRWRVAHARARAPRPLAMSTVRLAPAISRRPIRISNSGTYSTKLAWVRMRTIMSGLPPSPIKMPCLARPKAARVAITAASNARVDAVAKVMGSGSGMAIFFPPGGLRLRPLSDSKCSVRSLQGRMTGPKCDICCKEPHSFVGPVDAADQLGQIPAKAMRPLNAFPTILVS
jgi:hypothetical protein